MRKCLFLFLPVILTFSATAQHDFLVDSLKKNISLSHTDAEKAYSLEEHEALNVKGPTHRPRGRPKKHAGVTV